MKNVVTPTISYWKSEFCVVTPWLLVDYLFMHLFMRYPIKEDTDSGENTGVW